MSPAKKFSPRSRTPSRLLTKASTSSRAGTAVSNGHQYSTSVNPASRAAAARSGSGTSLNRIDRLAAYGREWPSSGIATSNFAIRNFSFAYRE